MKTKIFDIKNLIGNIRNDWVDVLSNLASPYEKHINESLTLEENILPSQDKIFAAFKECPFENIKVVIIGQDCYHHIGQANGLCFSVEKGLKCPPSLRNIFKELYNEYGIMRTNTDLTDWAHQGVLLLNTALTVRENAPGSHIKIWKDFTRDIVKYIAANKENVCYLLWGDYAISFAQYVNSTNNSIYTHSHPSPLARKPFVGCMHFKRCNQYLVLNKTDPINWV